ncbi:hypothetical protein [Peribacillus sp. NPDC058075]|uniref:hypothetical protein n=1 Tax=unclassified Peribacillus TaxID=2675266 RepID=UPI0036DAE0D2
MKKYFLTIAALFLTFLTGCGGVEVAPKYGLVANKGSANIEGDDVYFEYNGKYHVAKGQRKNYEANQGESMIVIQMSDGSYIIQKEDKNVAYQNGYDPVANKQNVDAEKQKREQARQAKLDRQQQLEDERIAYLRSKELKKQELDQQKQDLKAEAQTTRLQNATNYLQTQIGKIQAETQKIKDQLK